MKIERILLINPPAVTPKHYRDINPLPPLGLGYLAASVAQPGLEVKIADFLVRGWGRTEEISGGLLRVGLSDRKIIEEVQSFQPDLIGVSMQFSRQNRFYHHFMSLIKSVSPRSIIVAGGAHVTVCPEDILSSPHCAYIIRGEGESSLAHLIRRLREDKEPNGIDGLGRKSEGKLMINEKKEWIADLDSLPLPAYHLLELDRYFGLAASHGKRHRNRFLPMITSRGCPANCTFCSARQAWGSRYRVRSVENILKEMRHVKERYGIQEIMFEDDNITADIGRAKSLFSAMIREEFGFIWDTPNGAGLWSLDEEAIDLMKRSGCVKLNFPVESGSQPVLNQLIHKPVDLGKVKRLIAHCRKINLDYGVFLVIGMPGETLRDIWRSFSFCVKARCFNPHISVATPYPGSELFRRCQENGLFSRKFDLGELFIRSFMIRTKDWSEADLRRTLFLGESYLRAMSLFYKPVAFFRALIAYLKKPSLFVNYFKRYFYAEAT